MPKQEQIEPLKEALRGIERSLAESKAVELQRANEVIDLWQLNVPRGQTTAFSVRLDSCLARALHSARVGAPVELDPGRQDSLCREIGELAAELHGGTALPSGLVDETREQLISRLSIREAWLYRDWQAGIGDFMIVSAPEGARRSYDVMGYAEFEARANRADWATDTWLSRIGALFDGLEIATAVEADARIGQMESLWTATAALLLTLAEIEPEQARQLGNTIDRARRVVAATSPAGRELRPSA